MRLTGKRGTLLSRIGDADGRHLEQRQAAVVKTTAITQPVTAGIKSQQRHQQNSGDHARPEIQRFVNAEGTRRQHFAVGQAMKFQRQPFAHDARISDVATQLDQSL